MTGVQTCALPIFVVVGHCTSINIVVVIGHCTIIGINIGICRRSSTGTAVRVRITAGTVDRGIVYIGHSSRVDCVYGTGRRGVAVGIHQSTGSIVPLIDKRRGSLRIGSGRKKGNEPRSDYSFHFCSP